MTCPDSLDGAHRFMVVFQHGAWCAEASAKGKGGGKTPFECFMRETIVNGKVHRVFDPGRRRPNADYCAWCRRTKNAILTEEDRKVVMP